MASRKKIHDWDVRKFGKLKHQKGCLAGHVSYYAPSNSCSYRHQGNLRASSDSKKYTWPAGILGPKGEPPAKTPGKWDIGTPGNFQRKAGKPFYHESHHVVPNSELNNALNSIGSGATATATKIKVRGGLIDEEYNLNDKLNMIILPMTKRPSEVLNLPRHRRTFEHRSHRDYSRHVRSRLKAIMKPMTEAAKNCELEEYQEIREKIEKVSKRLYPKIRDAGPIALDDLFRKKSGKGM